MDAVERALMEEQLQDEVIMKKAARPRGTDSAKVIQVIETVALIGRGTHDDPVRTVTQYWDFSGNLLAESESKPVHFPR